jgi:hypothetical protein
MGMCPNQLRKFIIEPTLNYLDPEIPYSDEAVDLLMMTAAHESKLGKYIRQIGYDLEDTGGAYGIYQMEGATEADIFNNFLIYYERLHNLLRGIHIDVGILGTNKLMLDIVYATAMARVHYWRVPEALPKKSDYPEAYDKYLKALAKYAKKYYNTFSGKATWKDYYNDYKELVLNNA